MGPLFEVQVLLTKNHNPIGMVGDRIGCRLDAAGQYHVLEGIPYSLSISIDTIINIITTNAYLSFQWQHSVFTQPELALLNIGRFAKSVIRLISV